MQKGLAPLYLVHVHSRRRKLLEYVERMCLGLWFYINGSRLMRRTASFDLKSKTSPLLFFLSTFPVWWLMSLVSRFGLCCLAREQKELGRELFGCFFEKAFLGGSSTISTCTRKLDKLFCLYYYTFRSYLSIYSFFTNGRKGWSVVYFFPGLFVSKTKMLRWLSFLESRWHGIDRDTPSVINQVGSRIHGMHQHAKVKVQGTNTLLAYSY